MSFRLNDIFIGDYAVSQFYGSDPAIYNARNGLQGCPGVVFKCPTLTPILSAAPGFVLETGFEEAGKGKFITIVHDGFLTVYAHLNDIAIQKDEKVIGGQLIGHSNQSGLTDYPCLFFAVAPCTPSGEKTLENGFDGFIDVFNDNLVTWDIKNLTEPTTKADVIDNMTLNAKEYAILNAQATNYKVIISFLKNQTMFDDYLKELGRAPVNLETSPDDSAGGEAVTSYLTTIADEFEELNGEIKKLEDQLSPEVKEQFIPPEVPIVKKENFFIQLTHGLKRFIFKSENTI